MKKITKSLLLGAVLSSTALCTTTSYANTQFIGYTGNNNFTFQGTTYTGLSQVLNANFDAIFNGNIDIDMTFNDAQTYATDLKNRNAAVTGDLTTILEGAANLAGHPISKGDAGTITELILEDLDDTDLNNQTALQEFFGTFETIFEEPDLFDDVLNYIQDTISEKEGVNITNDDITSEAISTAFGLKYVCNDKAYDILERGYAVRGEKMNNNRAKMAYMPEGSELIIPDVGAPGYIVKNVFVLAGVPEIMCSMMQSVLPLLKKGKVVKSKHIEIMVGESAVAGEFQRLQNKYPQISMGSYPFQKDGKHGTSLVLRSNDYKSLEIAYQELEKMLHKNFY